MAIRLDKIILKNSSTPGNIPGTASLSPGEIAINTYDGRIYTLQEVNSTGSLIEIITSTTTGSIVITSASYATTASYALNYVDTTFPYTGSANISGSLTITGSLNVTGSPVTILSNIYMNPQTIPGDVNIPDFTNALILGPVGISGSVNLGTSSSLLVLDNFNEFATTAGPNQFNGNQTISGSLNVAEGITGSLSGTASFANNSLSASFALSASYAPVEGFPYTGSAAISGSLDVIGSFSVSNGAVSLAQVSASLNFADDIAAAAGGVPLGGLYRNGNFIAIRVS